MTVPEGINRPAEDRIVRLQRPPGNGRDRQPDVAQLAQQLKLLVEEAAKSKGAPLSRPQLYMKIGELVNAEAERHGWELSMPDRRQLIAELVAAVRAAGGFVGGEALFDPRYEAEMRRFLIRALEMEGIPIPKGGGTP